LALAFSLTPPRLLHYVAWNHGFEDSMSNQEFESVAVLKFGGPGEHEGSGLSAPRKFLGGKHDSAVAGALLITAFYLQIVPNKTRLCQLIFERLESPPEGEIKTTFQGQSKPSGAD
jgi:hypothetical protein